MTPYDRCPVWWPRSCASSHRTPDSALRATMHAVQGHRLDVGCSSIRSCRVRAMRRHLCVLPSGSVDLHAMERQRGVASPEGAVQVESSACAPGTKVPRRASGCTENHLGRTGPGPGQPGEGQPLRLRRPGPRPEPDPGCVARTGQLAGARADRPPPNGTARHYLGVFERSSSRDYCLLLRPRVSVVAGQVIARTGDHDSGLASSLLTTGQVVGGAIGLAALGTVAWTAVANSIRGQAAAARRAGTVAPGPRASPGGRCAASATPAPGRFCAFRSRGRSPASHGAYRVRSYCVVKESGPARAPGRRPRCG